MPPLPAPSAYRRFAPLLCLAAGLGSVFAFAPFGVWPLQLVAQALLFHFAAREASLARSLLLGWAYGFGCFAFGVYWPYVSMHRYGDLSPLLAGLGVALFSLLLGVFSGIAMLGANWLRQRWQVGTRLSFLVVFPSAWMLSEWLRDWVLTGFPWLSTGYAHTGGPLAGFAPIFGVFGVGWIAAIVAGSLVLFCTASAACWRSRWCCWPPASVCALSPGPIPAASRSRCACCKGIFRRKRNSRIPHLDESLAMYDGMLARQAGRSDRHAGDRDRAIAATLAADDIPQLVAFAKQTQSHLAIGIDISDSPGVYSNSLIDLSPQLAHDNLYRYDKHHLVPFGEFVPYGFHWFVAMLHIPLGDQTPGPQSQPPFAVKDQWILPNICYEDLFGEEIADEIADAYHAGKPQPTILLNISNMAWFGEWLAVPQHLQTSQMRALETGRPALRATNTGATAVIDPRGVVLAELPPYTRGTLAATVQGYAGLTPYILCGNALVGVLAMLSLIATGIFCRKRPR